MNIIRATNFISRSRFCRAIISEFGRDSVWNPKNPNLERILQSGKFAIFINLIKIFLIDIFVDFGFVPKILFCKNIYLLGSSDIQLVHHWLAWKDKSWNGEIFANLKIKEMLREGDLSRGLIFSKTLKWNTRFLFENLIECSRTLT